MFRVLGGLLLLVPGCKLRVRSCVLMVKLLYCALAGRSCVFISVMVAAIDPCLHSFRKVASASSAIISTLPSERF